MINLSAAKQAQIKALLDAELPSCYRGYFTQLLKDVVNDGASPLLTDYVRPPVDLRTFLHDPYFLGVPNDELWPTVVSELEECNSGRYIEAVYTGAIGTAKTTSALYTQAYQLYLLSCYENPHKILGIAETDEILFIFQNMTAALSKNVDFARFKAICDRSHYFTKVFPYNREIESRLEFPHRIRVMPLSGEITAAIGQNVYSGILEEVNFMEVVQDSKRTKGGELFDQARGIYSTISIRRKSRFMRLGRLPGVLCIVSSRNYPGQFTDEKEEQAEKEIRATGKSSIFIYDKRLWELKPDRYCGDMFLLFIGDVNRKPHILEQDEHFAEEDANLVMEVPVEHLSDFEQDMPRALRDIAGVSTLAKLPFIGNYDAIAAALCGVNLFSQDHTDFVTTKVTIDKRLIKHPTKPRWAHVDLALSGDCAGLAIGYVEDFVIVQRGGDQEEILPKVVIDGVLEIRPPKGGEINFSRIRELLYNLKSAGLPLKWVTFDSFQSVDSIQILRQKGFITGNISMDKTMLPYDFTKTAIYDARLVAPDHPKLSLELKSLELVIDKKKIDHPPNGSKDLSDSVAGVVYGLTTRRELWAGVKRIPVSVLRPNVPMGEAA